MASTKSSGARIAPPPRDLNVQSFAESRARELESLHAVVAARTGRQFSFPRSKRRRTTSFDDRIAKRRRRGKGRIMEKAGGEKGAKEEEKKLCRRLRRRKEFRENPEFGFATSADGTKRLRTHLWHAKRFTMTKRWGFFLPVGLHGKGRGSRALLRWLRTGTIVHDSSYCNPIELVGMQDSILAVLNMVLVPSPICLPENKLMSIISGACYGSAMLHYIGAPTSQFVAPVTYMWQPSFENCSDSGVETNCLPDCCTTTGSKSENNTFSRRIWIWLHAAAFKEGSDVLRSACLKQTNETGVTVHCMSLEGQLAKFEIMGHKAIETLHKLLHPAPELHTVTDSVLSRCTSSGSRTNTRFKKSSILKSIKHAPPHAILSLEVFDPRDLHDQKMREVSGSHPGALGNDSKQEDDKLPELAVDSDLNATEESILQLWSDPGDGANFLADSKHLWTFRDKISPPRKESILCLENHNKRLKNFYMDNASTGTSGRNTEEHTASFCPVLLAKHNNINNLTWWSVILPLNWAKAFWIPLISFGVHVAGQREKQWIASDNGLPSFPFDFPDCKAYTVTMASEAIAFDQAAELRPCSVRPSRIPIPPPWDCLKSSVQMGKQFLEDDRRDNIQPDGSNIVSVSALGDLHSGLNGSPAPARIGSFASCSVVRALSALCCDQKMTGDDRTSSFSESIEGVVLEDILEKTKLNWISNRAAPMRGNGNLWLVRVHLRSFREGFFEEGAVVCAPVFSDVLLWTCRSVEKAKLHIPQPQQYFVEREPRQWELQVPDDPGCRESFRWPIGFVTTGFVRGSRRPVAEAFCEATLLAQLRGQQQERMQEKAQPEIFVLVRNLRSTAYRLALATVVLEKQDEDLDFM